MAKNVEGFTAAHPFTGNWRTSKDFNLPDFNVSEVEVPFTPSYRGVGLRIEIDMEHPMVKELKEKGMFEKFLGFIGHAFRQGGKKGYADGVEMVQGELQRVLFRCNEVLRKEQGESKAPTQAEPEDDPPINPVLDDRSAEQLFSDEGPNIVRSTPVA